MLRLRKRTRVRDSFFCDAPTTRDPTGTLDLRKRYKSMIEMRWRKARAAVRTAIQTQDMMGLVSMTSVLSLALSGHGEEGKIKTFQAWFDSLLNKVVLEGDGQWLRPMVMKTYDRALKRIQGLLNTAKAPDDRDGTEATLETLAFTELQGIVEAVSQRAVRSVTMAMLHGSKPGALFRDIAEGIDKVGVTRSRSMIDVIVVKTHAVASLDTMKAAGMSHTTVVPETVPRIVKIVRDAKKPKAPPDDEELVNVLTAGDDDVCEICLDIADDNPYLIDEAYDLIPAHPNCRCAFTPYYDARFASDEWNEEDHPRGPDGKFGEGGGHTSEEKAAIQQYIGDDPYNNAIAINDKLRSGEKLTEDQDKTVKALDSAISKSPRTENDMVLYRGTDTNVYAGRDIRDPGYTSMTSSKNVAEEFATATSDNGHVYQITVPNGAKLLDVSPHQGSSMAYQKELLAKRGLRFEREGKSEKIGNITYHKLRAIGAGF